MLYDNKENILVSRKFDNMIAGPNGISSALSLLGGYNGSDLTEIFKTSFMFRRLFYLDMFMSYSAEESETVISMFEQVPPEVSSYLIWQTLACNSAKADRFKHRFKKLIKLYWQNVSHPYRYNGNDVLTLDSAMSQMCIAGDFAKKFSASSHGFILASLNAVRYSLFGSRLSDIDVFNEMGDLGKMSFMYWIARAASEFCLSRFTLTLLDSHGTTSSEKAE